MTAPVRWSNLKHMAKSPLHYRHYLGAEFVPTTAMLIGSLVHQLVLGGETHRCVKFDGKDRRAPGWKAFKAEHAGRDILTATEWATGEEIAGAVRSNTDAMLLLEAGEKEARLDWYIASRACHGTPDTLGVGLTDLKVTNDASPERFPWHARKMLWHAQLAWYGEAKKRVYGAYPERYSIVAVEPKPPYPVTIFDLTNEAVEAGNRVWRSCFDRLMVCEENNDWPGYSRGVELIDAGAESTTIIIDGEELTV